MFDIICNLPLTSDLTTQAIHATEPVLAVGLAGGHVETYRLDPVASTELEDGSSPSRDGFATVDTAWRTRRHKGSCRSLAFSTDGGSLFSAGTDELVKIASSATGQVFSKIAIPPVGFTVSSGRQKVQLKKDHVGDRSIADRPSLVHAAAPQTLFLATDSSSLHVYDLRVDSSAAHSKPQQTYQPHVDYVSSITPLPAGNKSSGSHGKSWLTTGGTTFAITDLRAGVVAKSEDFDEELLSSVFVGRLPGKAGRKGGEKALFGDGSGVISLWERSVWDDQYERIIVDKGSPGGGESLDVLVNVPEEIGTGKLVAAGMGNGRIKLVKLGVNKVVAGMVHDEVEAVVGLGFEPGGRMVSGGGRTVKVWQESVGGQPEEGSDESEEEEVVRSKGKMDTDDEELNVRSGNHIISEEVEMPRKRRKRHKAIGQSAHSGTFADID
ncbi:WD repeat-containing protein jip5 [Loxospora ochrophaea]|nr:WD repeat-containing protein jip5 [Loxospora ochrophaea]